MHNKNIPTCLGTAVLVIIAITAGAFVWVYERNQDPLTVAPPQLPQQIKGSDTTTQKSPEMSQSEKDRLTELTKDWRTYRDAEYGYEFKYPKEYSVKIDGSSDGKERNKVDITSNGTCAFNLEGAKYLCQVSIWVIEDDTWVKDFENGPDRHFTRFSLNKNHIIFVKSDALGAIVYATKKIYSINTTPRNETLDTLEGIYFTFKEL